MTKKRERTKRRSIFIIQSDSILFKSKITEFIFLYSKMHSSCHIETYKRKPDAITHCCKKKVCLEHLQEHRHSMTSQLNTFADEINILGEQLSLLNVQINSQSQQKT